MFDFERTISDLVAATKDVHVPQGADLHLRDDYMDAMYGTCQPVIDAGE